MSFLPVSAGSTRPFASFLVLVAEDLPEPQPTSKAAVSRDTEIFLMFIFFPPKLNNFIIQKIWQ